MKAKLNHELVIPKIGTPNSSIPIYFEPSERFQTGIGNVADRIQALMLCVRYWAGPTDTKKDFVSFSFF